MAILFISIYSCLYVHMFGIEVIQRQEVIKLLYLYLCNTWIMLMTTFFES